jgi:hypothetical protein
VSTVNKRAIKIYKECRQVPFTHSINFERLLLSLFSLWDSWERQQKYKKNERERNIPKESEKISSFENSELHWHYECFFQFTYTQEISLSTAVKQCKSGKRKIIFFRVLSALLTVCKRKKKEFFFYYYYYFQTTEPKAYMHQISCVLSAVGLKLTQMD